MPTSPSSPRRPARSRPRTAGREESPARSRRPPSAKQALEDALPEVHFDDLGPRPPRPARRDKSEKPTRTDSAKARASKPTTGDESRGSSTRKSGASDSRRASRAGSAKPSAGRKATRTAAGAEQGPSRAAQSRRSGSGSAARGRTGPGRRRTPSHRLPRKSRRRLFSLLCGFAVVFSLVGWRLVSIQGFGSAGLAAVSAAPQRTIVTPGIRGSILASNGDELALTEMRPTIFADPGEIARSQVAHEAAVLAPLLHQKSAALVKKLTRRTTYVVLATAVAQTLGARVAALGLAGIGTENIPTRYYPDGSMASPILGSLNAAGVGATGLENRYNSVLAGRAGKVVEEVDPAGYYVPGTRTVDQPAVNGDDLLTTIDQPLQFQTETALAAAIATAKAKGGTAIIMDTKTGRLLAVASLVAGPKHTVVEAPLSSAFSLVYEPGSVAKIVTLSAALATGAITPREKFTIPNQLQVANATIHDAENHPTEVLDPTGILAQSSNIGAIQVAQKLGPDALYRYLQAYGLTRKTDINFYDESAGILPAPPQWSGTSLATIAFGQGIAVTAAQMVGVINTIANGGVYEPPSLVTATVDASGREHPVSAGPSRRVVPASVAAIMNSDLQQVVSSGTGTAAQIPGYAVAGKTGTANQVGSDGKYVPDVYISSFAGFAPAADPSITAMVVIDQTGYYGAAAAAPAFSTIVRDALLDLDVPSTGPQPPPARDAFPVINGKVQLPGG